MLHCCHYLIKGCVPLSRPEELKEKNTCKKFNPDQ
jgi:hypothetical protein